MKIHEGHGPEPPRPISKVDKKSGVNDDFKKIMDEATHGTGPTEKAPGPSPGINPPGILIVPGGVEITDSLKADEKAALLANIKETLDFLDFYAEKMTNTSFVASDLEPMVEHLEDRARYLDGMKTNTGIPKALQTILTDLSLTIGTEVARFKRGDYD